MADDGLTVGRYRALLTETERRYITGVSNPDQDQKDQANYRVRSRIRDELATDVTILKQNRPTIATELRQTVCESPPLASGVDAYVAVAEYAETGEPEVLFNGSPIDHVMAEDAETDTLQWGYSGLAATNTSRTILSHACLECGYDDEALSPADVAAFRDEYIHPQQGEWLLPVATVEQWLRENVTTQ